MEKFKELQEKLHINFRDENLLQQAFCHRSYLNEHPDFQLSHNERLEFLGDAVLELVVSEYLYKKFPEKEEGFLTALRSTLVNSKMLSKIAQELDFDRYLLVSKGEKREIEQKGRAYRELMGNLFEAFLGALYFDQGYKKAQEFVTKHLLKEVPIIIENNLFFDAKSKFQEIAHEKERITPTYKILEEWGPDHAKEFIAGVFLGEELIAKGHGFSKKEAEEEAAKEALKIKKWH